MTQEPEKNHAVFSRTKYVHTFDYVRDHRQQKQGGRSWVGRVDNCPPRFGSTKGIEIAKIVSRRFPIFTICPPIILLLPTPLAHDA